MEQLISKYRRLQSTVSTEYVRGIYDTINWNARAISIQGARGTGKSTLMLQHVLKSELPIEQSLYVSLDDLWFGDNPVIDLATEFIHLGGKLLLLDEVHKYPDWQQVIKNIYDFNPDLQLIVSGSSIIALQEALPDLGRRVLTYQMPELSLREFIGLKYNIDLPRISWDDLLKKHQQISYDYIRVLDYPLKFLKEHQEFGAYPFFLEGESDYSMRLNQLINLVIDYDLPDVLPIETSSRNKLKQLLYILSTSVPFTPNISKLARQLDLTRTRLLEMLHILERAQLIQTLRSEATGVSLLNKPEKVYLKNTNLIHLLSNGLPEKGNVRETWMLSQLSGAGFTLTYPKQGDVVVNGGVTIEIGGKNKSKKQLSGIQNGIVAKDDIEHGIGSTIPLWLFGFLY
jgi:uncharacterized protein